MSELQGQLGEVKFTIEVKRAATGKVETYEMVGKVVGISDSPPESIPRDELSGEQLRAAYEVPITPKE